ncbi:MAG: ABC-type transport auxiliary lipoprotein family protein [Pseudoxanthomonas sp.]
MRRETKAGTRFFVTMALALLLAGCSVLGSGVSSGDRTTIYAPAVRVAADPTWPQVTWSLAIAQPTAPRMLDGSRIAVRPDTDELQVYRSASWSQSPPSLLADAVLRTLEDSGRIAAVARQESGIRADYKLVLDIRRFEADYAGAQIPSAIIEVNAKLLAVRDQKVVASRTFVQSQASAGTEVPQVVDAFGQSLERMTATLAGWVLDSVPTARP